MLGMLKKFFKLITTPKIRASIKQYPIRVFVTLKGRYRFACKRTTFKKGVNLIGHIRGDFGLGESCRLVASILKKTGLPFTIQNISVYGDAPEKNETWKEFECNELPYVINLIHLNPDGLQNSIWKLGFNTFSRHYNIGFYLWEQPEFPKEWLFAIDLMDEIWTPAEFISKGIRQLTDKPVYTMPYGMYEPNVECIYDRAHFGLPQNICLFMVSYDGYSSSERKNPIGSVRAYAKAFSKSDINVGLVIKATHARENDLEQFRKILQGYPNIIILKNSYDKIEFNSLVACVDVYVSLHRAEGFGLVMAEAMLLETAVIATNWSANTEFMNEDVACMVSADIVTLEKDSFPYKKGTHWARPSEQEAVNFMKRLAYEPQYRKEKITKAKHYIEQKLSPIHASKRIKDRIEEIYQSDANI